MWAFESICITQPQSQVTIDGIAHNCIAQSPKLIKCENDKRILNEIATIESTRDLEKCKPQMGFEHFGKVFENQNNEI